jgi:transposase
MAKELVTDELWETIEPLLPPEAPKPRGGRPRIEDRAALTGIVFVLKSAVPWEMLSQEMGCGSGMSCWRRLREWQEAGCGRGCTGAFSIASGRLSSSTGSVPLWIQRASPPKGGAKSAANPTDKGKKGTKRHLVSDRKGIPLAALLTAANTHDSMVFEELIDAVESIKRPGRGRTRKRPEKLHAYTKLTTTRSAKGL